MKDLSVWNRLRTEMIPRIPVISLCIFFTKAAFEMILGMITMPIICVVSIYAPPRVDLCQSVLPDVFGIICFTAMMFVLIDMGISLGYYNFFFGTKTQERGSSELESVLLKIGVSLYICGMIFLVIESGLIFSWFQTISGSYYPSMTQAELLLVMTCQFLGLLLIWVLNLFFSSVASILLIQHTQYRRNSITCKKAKGIKSFTGSHK